MHLPGSPASMDNATHSRRFTNAWKMNEHILVRRGQWGEKGSGWRDGSQDDSEGKGRKGRGQEESAFGGREVQRA